jgi:hypothetical protein
MDPLKSRELTGRNETRPWQRLTAAGTIELMNSLGQIFFAADECYRSIC